MLEAERMKNPGGALQPAGALPFQSFLTVRLSGDRKGQRGGAMCLKLHSLLSVSTQLLGMVSSVLHPGIHIPKFQPQP